MQAGYSVNLVQKVEETIRRDRLLEPGMRVAVACSGGADSVALALLLNALKTPLGLQLVLAHFNHQLRGADSEADEAFVHGLAESLQIDCIASREEVAARARRGRLNLEAAGREARRVFFSSLIENGAADAIALAHTLDDQAETVLARMLRGAGTHGLAGIYPVVEIISGRRGETAESAKAGRLVRPLLGSRRTELRDYLAEREQPWREDATNRDPTRLRNRLRLELLPQLSRIAGHAAEHLARLADHAREEESFWAAYSEETFRTLVERTGDSYELSVSSLRAPAPSLARLPARQAGEAQRAVARRLLRRILRAVRGNLRQVTQAHVEAVLHLAVEGTSGSRLTLPGVIVDRQFDRLRFRPSPWESESPAAYELVIDAPGEVTLPGQWALRVKLVEAKELEGGYNKLKKNLVDAGRVRFPLRVRNWQAGDAYRPLGASRPKKLKELFQQGRVPLPQRAGYPVVLSGEEIVWVPGFGPASCCSLRKTSGRALLLEEQRGNQ